MFDIMFDIIFNWIAKIRTKRELLKLYRMVKEKKRDILYSCDTERFRRYYDETELLENALAYILYTKFDCDNDRDVVWDYQFVSDVDIQEYIDNLSVEQECVDNAEDCNISNYNLNRMYYYYGNIDDFEMDYIRSHFQDGTLITTDKGVYLYNGNNFIKC